MSALEPWASHFLALAPHPVGVMPSGPTLRPFARERHADTADRAAGSGEATAAARRLLAPLALTQFVASFAGSNMNVAINSIAKDLGTTVHGVQTAITLFLLTMAALMIPGSKLTDKWGRKRCLNLGLTVYGAGAVIAALAPGLGVLILGYSAFEGVGSALMIPPIYILATLYFDDVQSRARAFGVISGMAGVGAAAGPLVGGLITTAISWRASFLLQAAIVAAIVILCRRMKDPLPADPTRRFDTFGAVLSAVGMLLLVLGILQAGDNWTLFACCWSWALAVQGWFFLYVRSEERHGKEPLLSTSLFRSRTSNLAMVTQNVQWLLLMGSSFRGHRVPPGRPRLQRDQDRRGVHRGHRGHPRLLAGGAATGPTLSPADPDHRRLRHHADRNRPAAAPCTK